MKLRIPPCTVEGIGGIRFTIPPYIEGDSVELTLEVAKDFGLDRTLEHAAQEVEAGGDAHGLLVQ